MSSQVEMFDVEAAPVTLIQTTSMEGFLEAIEIPSGSPSDYTMEDKINLAVSSVVAALRLGKSLSVMVSFGKDSSVLLSLTLAAVEKAKILGIQHPTVHVCHGDTGRENPVIATYARKEIQKLEAFIKARDLKVKFHKVTPRLTENFLCLMLGGKDIASMPGMQHKCQAAMKASPLARAQAQIRKEVAQELGIKPQQLTHDHCITLIGTRFDESNARSKAMRLRGESSTVPSLVTKNGNSNWILSPVSDWLETDIYEFIASVTNNRRETYSDFHQLTEVYRDAMGECMAIMGLIGMKESSAGCGARHGCWSCTVIGEDKSLNNMINSRSEYQFMKPLAKIRDYISAMTFDPTKRCWTTRTVDPEKGTFDITPNAYAPHFTEELLRIMITADAEEWERTDGKPEFQIITFEELIFIDSLWSRYNYHRHHKALKIWHEIWEEGERFYVPDSYPVHERTNFPKISNVPFADSTYDATYNGFMDVNAAQVDTNLLVGENGYFNANTDSSFSIDQEGLDNFLQFSYDHFIKTLHKRGEQSLFTYMRYGFVQLQKGGHSEWDRMIRVGTQLFRHGIHSEDMNDPITIIQKITGRLKLDDITLANIDKQLSDPSFVKFYQDHYFKPVTLTNGQEATVYTPRRQEQQLDLLAC